MTANWIPAVYHGRVQRFIIAGSSLGPATSPLLFTWMLMQFGWRASFALAALGTVFWAWRGFGTRAIIRRKRGLLSRPAASKRASRAS